MKLNRKTLGLILIALGFCVWLFYAGAKLAGISLQFATVLAVHLCFVIPGALLAPGENFYGKILKWIKPKKNSALPEERE